MKINTKSSSWWQKNRHCFVLSSLSNNNEKSYFNDFLYICSLMVLISVLYFIGVEITHSSNESRGTFGDLFGGLNTIFSGFAFAGVLITILMQMRELKETRQELKKSAEAQEKSQMALNEQLKSMELTSKIQILESFKDSIINRKIEDVGKYHLAQRIINHSTYGYFTLEKYRYLLRPNIYQFSSNETGDKSLNPRTHISLKNRSHPAKIIDVNLPNGFDITHNKDNRLVSKNKEFYICGILEDSKKYACEIILESMVIPYEWSQKLNFKKVDGTIEFEYSTAQQINKNKIIDIDFIISRENIDLPKIPEEPIAGMSGFF